MKTLKCPICKSEADTTPANAHRPFCSERCKLVDLSKWLSDDYIVPGHPVSPELLETRTLTEA